MRGVPSWSEAHVHLHNVTAKASSTVAGDIVMVEIDRAALLVFNSTDDIDAVIKALTDARDKLVLHRLAVDL